MIVTFDHVSAVLLIVLAALWAAVLVPATLRTRDTAAEIRSIDGFHHAMRTLSRRTVPSDGRMIMIPTPAVTDVPRRESRARIAQRRLFLLRVGWAAVATLSLALFVGGFAWAVHIGVDIALVGYVGWLRQQAVTEQMHARERRRAFALERERLEHERYLARLDARRNRPVRAVLAYDDEDVVPIRRAVND